jgi:hypothetical protein
MVTQVTAAELQPVILFKAEFDSGDVLLWTGIGEIDYDGDTYTGAGNLIGVSSIDETTGIEARGASFNLSGANSAILSLALTEDYQGRAITAFFGVLDTTLSLVSDPIILFKGIMDVIRLDDSGNVATITVAAENRLIDLLRTKTRRYTEQDQKAEFSGDTGCDFVVGLQEKEVTWGKTINK